MFIFSQVPSQFSPQAFAVQIIELTKNHKIYNFLPSTIGLKLKQNYPLQFQILIRF